MTKESCHSKMPRHLTESISTRRPMPPSAWALLMCVLFPRPFVVWICYLFSATYGYWREFRGMASMIVTKKTLNSLGGRMNEAAGSQVSSFARRQMEKFGWTE